MTAVNDWEGSASVMILRGKPRKIYDVKFKVGSQEGGGRWIELTPVLPTSWLL